MKLLYVFILFLLLFSFFQFQSSHIIGHDGYLHIKVAELIKENGFFKEFPFITQSILNSNYADTQFFFRVLLIPFTLLGLVLGAKISAIIFSALFFSSFYFVLSKLKIQLPLLWTLLLFFSSFEYMYRFLFPRPMAIFMAGLFVFIYLLIKRKYFWSSLISIILVWLYQGFVFLIMIVLIYFLVELLFFKKLNLQSIIYPLIGVVLGLLLNPYFPLNLEMLYLQLVQVNLIGNLFNEEWRAWPILTFLFNSLIYLIAFIFGIFVLIKSKKLDKNSIFFFLIALIYLIFAITSRRMIEYFAPFSILFCSYVFSKVNFKKFKIQFILIPIILLLVIFNSINLNKAIDERSFLHNFQGCSDYMAKNVPDNSIVFINGYAFNYLFFNNPNLRFTHGIDGTYSYLFNKEKFGLYIKLLQGKPLTRDIIKEDFKADYVFAGKIKVDKNLNNFLIKNQKNYELMYEDKECAVFKVRD